MKRIHTSLAIGILAFSFVNAQNEVDALRFSQTYYGGTARAISMANSSGAMGGDFSSLSINPAGIGVYRSSEFTATPTVLFNNTSSDYLGGISEDSRYQFLFNNVGFVASKLTENETGWKGYSFGVGYNRLNNYHRDFLMRGRQERGDNRSSSFMDNMTDYANSGGWDPYFEELLWQTYLMDYDSLAGEYFNDARDYGYGQYQRQRVQESGGAGEYLFSFGGNYGDRLYMGATFSINRLSYQKDVTTYEVDDQGVINFFDSFTFREHYYTNGTGYTFKAGLLYRPVNMIRLGAAFHIPTFYRITEEFNTSIEATYDPSDWDPVFIPSDNTNISEYKLRTPFRAIGSVAFQIPRIATINIDYEYVDYSSVNLDSRDYGFFDENETIRTLYTSTSNIRLGGEVKLGAIYLRGGAGFYQSPFVKDEANSDAYTIGYAGGIGFRGRTVFFDMGYSGRTMEERYYLYVPQDVRGASIQTNSGQLVATLGFRF